MPVVQSVDYVLKRIYLHSDTVGVDLDTMDVYKEVRALRESEFQTPYPHRGFKTMIIQGGNIQKTPTTKTPKYVQLLYGCRIVPFDANQLLKVIRDTFTDDGLAGRDCFDRIGLSNFVDIDYQPPQVEVIEVATGSGVTAQDKIDISIEVWKQLSVNNQVDGSFGKLITDLYALTGKQITSVKVGVDTVITIWEGVVGGAVFKKYNLGSSGNTQRIDA